MAACQPGIEPFAIKVFRHIIVRPIILPAFDNPEQLGMAHRHRLVDQILEVGRIPLTLRRAYRHMEFYKEAGPVIKSKAGDFFRTAPDFDR